jgi:branched-chain amino acid transport system permease protein
MVQTTASGAILGLFYALVAGGLYVGVVGGGLYNLAYGGTVLVAGYAAYGVLAAKGPMWAGASAALGAGVALALVTQAALGAAGLGRTHRTDREQGRAVVLTLALALFIDAVLLLALGADPRKISTHLSSVGLGPWPFRIVADRAVAAGVGLVLVAGLDVLFTRTHLGSAMRAIVQDEDLAQSYGLPPRRYLRISWAISGAIGGVAGFLFGIIAYLQPYGDGSLLFAALVLVVATVPGPPRGLLVWGVALGATQGIVSFAAGAEWQAAVFFLAFSVLVLMRTGTRSWA